MFAYGNLIRVHLRNLRLKTARSNPQKNLPAIHPEHNETEHQQDRRSMKQGFISRSCKLEKVLAKVRLQILGDEVIKQVRDSVRRD